MATTSSVLEITAIDSQNYDIVYKIDNARLSPAITMASIHAAYDEIMNAGLLYSKYDNPITTIARAQIITTTIEKTDVPTE